MNNIVIKNIEPQNIRISGAGEVIGITAVYVNGVNVTEGSVAYVIVPTKTSQLENNSGFLTQETDPTIPYYIKQIRLSDITRWNNKQDELVSGVNIKTINSNSLLGSGNIDITTSYTAGTGISISNENVISNDITSYNDLTDLPTIPTKISDLTNDSNFVESTSLAEVAFNGSYLALSNTPDSTSDFTNDGENGVDPFITNKTNSLENYYNIDYMWNLLPHVSDSDTNINLSPTVKDTTLKMSLDPSTLSQDGTPTPSSPQDIHTISGSNTIKVEGKNLAKSFYTPSTTQAYIRNLFIDFNIQPDTTYTFSFETNQSGNAFYWNETIFTTSLPFNSSSTGRTSFTATTKSDLSGLSEYDNTANGYAILKNYRTQDTTPTFSNVQVEVGSTATTYTPYVSQEATINLGDIEYCKIGTYSDRIFKNVSSDPDYSNERDEGAWYIKKNIGKVVLDGTENWRLSGTSSSPTNRTVIISDIISTNSTNYLSNRFIYNSATSNRIVLVSPTAVYISLDDTLTGITGSETDNEKVEKMKSWLVSNNTDLYYILATPTYTQITGTLATQLDTIEDGLKAYNEQTNISQVNADLPFVINADTLKSLANL